MEKLEKKLLNSTIIYFIGNALTQIISLVLMRFVTNKVVPEEYGIYSLVVTITNLVVPIVTLQISDAVFKFLIKSVNIDQKEKYFTAAIYVSIFSTAIIILGIFITNFFITIPHIIPIALYMLTTSFFTIYHRVVRALGRNKVYVIGNLGKTALYLGLEILLLYAFGLGVEALFLSVTISNIVCIIFLEIKTKAFKFIKFHKFDAIVFKAMLMFSLPLVPNAICWWLTSSVNSIIVSTKIGLDVNGIYSVAHKFSSALTLITSVFALSWQETAIAGYDEKEFKTFFTQTFNMYVTGVFSVISALIPFVFIVFPFMIDQNYGDAVMYVPFLLIASGESALAGFFAQVFIAKGDSKKVFLTNAFGMVTNIVIVFLLISKIGLWAAVVGTCASELVVACSRMLLLRKEFARGINVLKIIISFAILVISVFIYFYLKNVIYNVIWCLISLVVAVALNFKFIRDLLSIIFKKRIKRANHE